MQTSFELTPKQAEYIRNANHRWNVACGAVRSGKSYCQISYCIPARIMERKNKRGLRLILGVTRDSIERNVLQPMRDLYGDGIATTINSQNTSRILGDKVYCIGADNIKQVAKIKGSEVAYCAIDEGTDINEQVFQMLKSRMSLPWSCADITTNPASPNHWFKKFLDSAKNGVDIYQQKYTIYDNPFLPEEYIKSLEAEYAGSIWYDRYILGEWTLAEGLVYPNFKNALGEIPIDVFPSEYVISLDYGTSNPFAAILWSKRGEVWYGEKCIYYSGRDTGLQKTDEEYLGMLNDMVGYLKAGRTHLANDFWGNTIELNDKFPTIVDPSAASFITLLRQSTWFNPIPADNEVINGIRNVNTAMARGVMKIDPSLEDWIKEAQSYIWDTQSSEDRPIKDNDHLMDATRYFVNTKRIVTSITNYDSILEGRRNDYISRL